MKLLRSTFQAGTDYIYEGSLEPTMIIGAGKKREREKLLAVSYLCLKEISLMLQTSKASEIRKAVIRQEMLFRLYMKYQTDFLAKKILEEQTTQLTLKDSQIAQLQSIRPKKRRTRPKFPRGFFIYIALTRLFLSDGEFKIGKTNDLLSLFSEYNRLTKTVFVFYRDCGNETNMNAVEAAAFNRLAPYRRYQNGEKFLLKDKDLSFFFESIDGIVDFVSASATEGEGIRCLEMIEDLKLEDDFDVQVEEVDNTSANRNFIRQVDRRVQELEDENLELRGKLEDSTI